MSSSVLQHKEDQEIVRSPCEKELLPHAPAVLCVKGRVLGKKGSGFDVNCSVLEGGSGNGFPNSDVLLLII